MNKSDQIKDWVYIAGLLVMVVMAVLPLADVNHEWMRYAYAAGAAVALIARLTMTYKGKNFRIRRLFVMGHIAAVLYCVSAALTFLGKGTADWIAMLLAGALLQVYSSSMIEREQRRDARRKEEKKAKKQRK